MVLHHISLFKQDSLQLEMGINQSCELSPQEKIKFGEVYTILERKSDLSGSVGTSERKYRSAPSPPTKEWRDGHSDEEH